MTDGTRWTVRSSRVVLNDKWICLRADDCVTPDGVEIAPYYVLEYPDFVHVAAFDAHDRLVLVRQYRHGLRDLSLELPGGVMDADDADPAVTAVRELREETGYEGSGLRHRTTLSMNPGTFANRLHLFTASAVPAGVAKPEATENIEVVLVARKEARHLALSGGIASAPHVALVLTALAEQS